MKANLTNARSHTTGSTKSKKNNKEREKRKSQSEKQETNDKGSPTKDTARKYAGIGPDSVLVYSVDANCEELQDDVCYSFAEDLSYKLRYVIHDALIRARLSGRNYVISNDVAATLESLNLDKVYGASSTPNWTQGPEQDLYFLSDKIISLVNIAEEECTYTQPGDINVTRKWLPEIKEPPRILKQYFETVCNAVVSTDIELKHTALKDISTNSSIGPIVEWFYNFCYFLLSKDITYDSLTLSALDLIKSLEFSTIASLTVSEKQLTLLVRLILQRLLRSHTTSEVLKPMAFVLRMLCSRIPIRDMVLAKLRQKYSEIKCTFTLPLLAIVNALGMKGIKDIFISNTEFFLGQYSDGCDLEYFHAISITFRYLCCSNEADITDLYMKFQDVLGEKIMPLSLPNCFQITSPKMETNWLGLKIKLIKTRSFLPHFTKEEKKLNIDDVFPENKFEILEKPKKIRFNKNIPSIALQDYDDLMKDLASELTFGTKELELLDQDLELKNDLCDILKQDLTSSAHNRGIMIGKRTLLSPALKQRTKCSNNVCVDHSLMYYNI